MIVQTRHYQTFYKMHKTNEYTTQLIKYIDHLYFDSYQRVCVVLLAHVLELPYSVNSLYTDSC
jgi:hypothetical protein